MNYLLAAALVTILSACSSTKYHKGKFSEIENGYKLTDLRPVPKGSTDLREFALSLPILEGRDEDTINWFYEMSDPAPTQMKWELPADGAQDPATIKRLPVHTDGSQQIEVLQFNSPRETPMISVFTNAKLKRVKDGWLVLESRIETLTYEQ